MTDSFILHSYRSARRCCGWCAPGSLPQRHPRQLYSTESHKLWPCSFDSSLKCVTKTIFSIQYLGIYSRLIQQLGASPHYLPPGLKF